MLVFLSINHIFNYILISILIYLIYWYISRHTYYTNLFIKILGMLRYILKYLVYWHFDILEMYIYIYIYIDLLWYVYMYFEIFNMLVYIVTFILLYISLDYLYIDMYVDIFGMSIYIQTYMLLKTLYWNTWYVDFILKYLVCWCFDILEMLIYILTYFVW